MVLQTPGCEIGELDVVSQRYVNGKSEISKARMQTISILTNINIFHKKKVSKTRMLFRGLDYF